jgi:hypothetical protein
MRVDMLKRETDRGFTKDRTMQHIGSIPITIWLNHPEFMNDSKALDKWLMSEQGSPYRIAKST